jgi:hypothetical protein
MSAFPRQVSKAAPAKKRSPSVRAVQQPPAQGPVRALGPGGVPMRAHPGGSPHQEQRYPDHLAARPPRADDSRAGPHRPWLRRRPAHGARGVAMQQGTAVARTHAGRGINLGPWRGRRRHPARAGLINEAGGRRARPHGRGMLALAKIMQAPRRPAGRIRHDAHVHAGRAGGGAGPGHPGRIMELVRHSADPVVPRGAGALELVSNPPNFAEAARSPVCPRSPRWHRVPCPCWRQPRGS